MEKWLLGLLWARIFGYQTTYERFFGFVFTKSWFINIICLWSILFGLFILFIFMFFSQVSLGTFSFTWWIFRTMSLLIIINSLVYRMPKRWRCFFRTTFSTSVKVFSFSLFLGFTGSWIGCILKIEVSVVFFILFLQVIGRVSGVLLDKLSIFPYKP